MKELELLWTELQDVITDGSPGMIGKRTSLMGIIRREMYK
jgi:hypothetical protein